jgi:Mg/Co/Ni transporter MgtE
MQKWLMLTLFFPVMAKMKNSALQVLRIVCAAINMRSVEATDIFQALY